MQGGFQNYLEKNFVKKIKKIKLKFESYQNEHKNFKSIDFVNTNSMRN